MKIKLITRFIAFIALVLVTAETTRGQVDTTAKKLSVFPVPVIGYSPETRTYLGGAVLFTFRDPKDSLTRTSNAKIEFTITWNKQYILDADWNYFMKKEKWFTPGKLHYSRYPDFYYGIGINTPDSSKLLYTSNRFIFDAGLLRKIGNSLFTGLNLRYIQFNNVSSGEFPLAFPELVSRSNFGIGYTLLKDSRNSILTPMDGLYFYGNIAYNFSSENYSKATIDLRYYKSWRNKYVWAIRFLNDLTFGTPPFYDYSFLGGDKYVRGYTLGRYRDKNLTTLQTEIRLPIVWRFGLAGFGGISNIYPKISSLKADEFKFNAGIGLRFLVDKKGNVNLRIDYAIGSHGNSGFYISFGESF